MWMCKRCLTKKTEAYVAVLIKVRRRQRQRGGKTRLETCRVGEEEYCGTVEVEE